MKSHTVRHAIMKHIAESLEYRGAKHEYQATIILLGGLAALAIVAHNRYYFDMVLQRSRRLLPRDYIQRLQMRNRRLNLDGQPDLYSELDSSDPKSSN
jgi:hypothetical protein